MKEKLCMRYTESGEHCRADALPLPEYPRPSMVRDSYLCLNGEWDFAEIREGGVPAYGEKIRVPYAPECLLSGLARRVGAKSVLCYRRRFSLDTAQGGRILLHFGAVSGIAEVSLNGKALGRHEGSYSGFSFDITELVEKDNELLLFVRRDRGTRLPWGKQRKRRGGMWYTPVSGIWQTVWLERVPERYIRALSVETDLEGATVTLEGVGAGELILPLEGEELRFPIRDGRVRATVPHPELWTPENPKLYPFRIEAGEDRISSYFALRTVGTVLDANGRPRLALNGKPYFWNGLLDQGYYSDGLYTPASYDLYEQDILTAKSLGFNLLRKHIKVEPEQFYYACDRLGIGVWQDAVNNGSYRFLRDTALPTVGMRYRNDRHMHKKAAHRETFLKGMAEMVGAVKHFPSVIGYTIFNEGWGQFDHAACYRRIKELDSSRTVDSVSGWFQPKAGKSLVSDVLSIHTYFKPLSLKLGDLPLVLSEFGGYSYRLPEHAFNLRKNYGYRTLHTREEFTEALTRLYLDELLPAVRDGLSAAVYTQLSDIEDETNGLLTYDRRVVKVDTDRMALISEKLAEAHRASLEEEK